MGSGASEAAQWSGGSRLRALPNASPSCASLRARTGAVTRARTSHRMARQRVSARKARDHDDSDGPDQRCAAPASGARRRRPAVSRRPAACSIRAASTTRAASASSPISRAASRTASSRTRSTSSRTSSIAVPWAPIPIAGDGAGILIQIPHDFLAEECAKLDIKLPKPGHYAVGHIFMPQDERLRAHCERVWKRHDPRAGPGVPRLALGAGHRHQAVRHGAGDRAGASPDLHRPAEGDQEPGRLRAQALPDPQDRLQRHLRRLQGRRHRPLHRVAVEPHAGLQGHVPVLPGEGLLRGPVGRAAGLGDGAGASALLDQHLPVVEAGAPLSHGRPQRRDQHAARQRQLDGGAAGVGRLAAVRRRDLQAVADLLRGPVRHGLLRQRARVPGDGRLQPGARRHDADPRGLGRQSADGCQAARLLRVSRLPDGAVGRPGGDGLHRRPPDRRHARPQRPAAGALSRDQGRHGDHVVGGRRAAGRGSQHRQASGVCSPARCC